MAAPFPVTSTRALSPTLDLMLEQTPAHLWKRRDALTDQMLIGLDG
ncbi:hypothetical protein [Bosea sp. TAF32]